MQLRIVVNQVYQDEKKVETTALNIMGQDVSPEEPTYNYPVIVPKNGQVTSFERWFVVSQEDIPSEKQVVNFKLWSETDQGTGLSLYYKTQVDYTTPQSYTGENWQTENGFTLLPMEEPTLTNLPGTLEEVTDMTEYGVLVLEVSSLQKSGPSFDMKLAYDEIDKPVDVESIEITGSSFGELDSNVQLEAIVSPENAMQEVTWDVASFDPDGFGETYVSEISVQSNNKYLVDDQTLQMKTMVLPFHADDTDVECSIEFFEN